MAEDALDPGPLGEDGKPTYPHWPRRPDGAPAGIGLPVTTQGEKEAEERMPTGISRVRDPKTGEILKTDITPRDQNGAPIVPPTIPPTP